MSNFDKAIEIILAEPPEMHYPAYFANLLRQADVPNKDVGKCSEIPNSSETIYRQAAIDAINCDITITGKQNAEVVAETIASFVDRIKALPSAEPETAKRLVGKSRDGMTLWYQCDMCNEPVDAQDNFCRGCGRRLTDG